MIRLLIADDEEMIRTAMVALLRLEPDIDVVAECANGDEAVRVAQEAQPDVCLLDVEMPGTDGVDAAEHIRKTVSTRVVMVTRHARPGVLRRALAAGVHGFIPKSRRAEDVAEVIRQVADGRRYIDPEVAADALVDERSPLTDRELDVLRVGSNADSIAEIASELHLSPGTVRNHISSILGKMHVRTRQQASREARDRGWI